MILLLEDTVYYFFYYVKKNMLTACSFPTILRVKWFERSNLLIFIFTTRLQRKNELRETMYFIQLNVYKTIRCNEPMQNNLLTINMTVKMR